MFSFLKYTLSSFFRDACLGTVDGNIKLFSANLSDDELYWFMLPLGS